MGLDSVHASERAFYDAHAERLDPGAMPPRPLHEFDRAMLDRLGPVAGRQVLDAGCGAGEVTLELLARGARVTALDLSPGMVAVARERVKRFRPDAEAEFVVAPLERTELAESSRDLVVGKWVLHHVDLTPSVAEVARVLRPGGAGVFFENQALNPLLRFARRRLAGRAGVAMVGTPDEHPLDEEDFRLLARAFAHVELDYPNFYFFEIASRNLLRESAQAPAQALDRLVWRAVPALRRYGYHVLIRVAKAR
jgi:ubiquinone/menaquinone biosynthesis C-methylase UbiE